MKKRKFIAWVMGMFLLAGCGQEEKKPHHLKVGVITGVEQQLAETAKQVAKDKYGVDVELISFNDYVLPNEALNKGDLDINVFQHKPYLEQQIQERGYRLASVGRTFLYPLAAYSKKISSKEDLQAGAQVAVPNDPTNLARSLLLMESQGLITLKQGVGLLPTKLDISQNPKYLNIIELEAPQLPRSLDDKKIDLAIINTTYAAQVGLDPSRDSLFMEDKTSPYVNLIVAREDNKDDKDVLEFVQAYESDEVLKKADEIFGGSAIQAWDNKGEAGNKIPQKSSVN